MCPNFQVDQTSHLATVSRTLGEDTNLWGQRQTAVCYSGQQTWWGVGTFVWSPRTPNPTGRQSQPRTPPRAVGCVTGDEPRPERPWTLHSGQGACLPWPRRETRRYHTERHASLSHGTSRVSALCSGVRSCILESSSLNTTFEMIAQKSELSGSHVQRCRMASTWDPRDGTGQKSTSQMEHRWSSLVHGAGTCGVILDKDLTG